MTADITWRLNPADANSFTGNAYSRLIGSAEESVPVKVYYVRFEPGARTNWHTHAGPQILVVSSGRCRYQREGEPVTEIGVGESVRFEPGVRHWHGASARDVTEHIAVNLTVGETVWLEPVSEESYGG